MVEDCRKMSAARINTITRMLIHEGRRSVSSLTNGKNSVSESPLVYDPPRDAVRSIQPVEIEPNAL